MSSFRSWFNRATPGTGRAEPCRRRPTFEVLEDRLVPATIVVTTHADVVAPGGKVSLREAITMANATEERDTIVLQAGDYQITRSGAGEDDNDRGDFDITRPVTIRGAGTAATVIDAASLDRVFDLNSTVVDATFTRMTIRNGFAPDQNGGGISARTPTRVTLNRTRVRDNAAGDGGGVYSDSSGTVTLNHSTVSGNVASGSGGGIFAAVSVILNQSRVRDNRAEGDGGGIHTVFVDVRLTKSTVSGNVAGGSGGGINAANGGEVILLGSTVSGNASGVGGGGIAGGSRRVSLLQHSIVSDNVTGGNGGGLASFDVTVDNSTVARNVAGNRGGGIEGLGGEVILTGSVVADNVATGNGGGIADDSLGGFVKLTDCRVSGNVASGPTADGGGLFVTSATLQMSNSTVSRNRAGDSGGGIYGKCAASIDFCTLSDNTAALGGGIFMDFNLGLTRSTLFGNGAGVGGGIFLNAGQSDISNVTLSGNTASQGGGGGLFTNATVSLFHATVTGNAAEAGGGILNNVGIVKVKNTIIAQNQATDGATGGPDVSGDFTSFGSNLLGIVDGSTGFDPANLDMFGTAAAPLDARLKPLADNGGPTLTHALKTGSPAIDTGDDDLGFLTDQRGFDRDKDGDGDGSVSVDIGALER